MNNKSISKKKRFIFLREMKTNFKHLLNKRKILAIALIIFILLEEVYIYKEPIIINAMTQNEYEQKMNAFINDSRWCNGVAWGYYQKPIIAWNGIGCCAYVNDFVRYIYGADSQNDGISYTGVSNIQAGDVLYIYNSDWGQHWIAVLGRNGDTLYTAEGNALCNNSYYGVRISNTQYKINGNTLYSNYVGTYTLEKGYHYYNLNPQVDEMNFWLDAPTNGQVIKGKNIEIWGWSQYKKYQNDSYIGANITANLNGKNYDIPASDPFDGLPRFWRLMPESSIKGGTNTVTVTAAYNGITRSETRTFTVTTPTILSAKTSLVSSTTPYYTIICDVSDDTEVSYVDFKIWTEANGEDDVEWQKAVINSKTGTATGKIYKDKHNNEKGNYKVTVYVHRTETIYGEKTYNLSSLFIFPLKNISLNKSSITMENGGTEKLSVNYNPSYTTDNQSVIWSSSNTQVATVSSTGQITAKSKGTTTITATVGNCKATCTVTVNDIIPTNISLNKTNITLTGTGATETLSATVLPTNAKDKSIKWSTSNANVATVDSSGKITAIGSGTAVITAITNSGGKSATCTVTVNDIIPTNISLNKTNITLTGTGATETLSATVLPTNAKDKSIKWSTSNTSVATVDSSGKVTAIGSGTVVITATTNSGGKSVICIVTVNIKNNSILYGDVNNNGSINIQDAVYLKKHLAGMAGIKIDEAASDVNVDGNINISDAVILIKYFAGMKVELGKK